MKKSFRKIATGVGVVGMLGVGGLAQENQSYQQGTEQSSQGTQPGQQGSTQQRGATSQREQPTSQRQMQGQTGQSQRGSSESTSMGQQEGTSYESSGKRTASSAQGEAMRGEKERGGRIRSVDTSSKTLTLKGPRMRNQEIAWSNKTEVLRNGKSVSPEALREGERVRVTYRNQEGRLVASQIVIGETRRQARRASRHSHQGY